MRGMRPIWTQIVTGKTMNRSQHQKGRFINLIADQLTVLRRSVINIGKNT